MLNVALVVHSVICTQTATISSEVSVASPLAISCWAALNLGVLTFLGNVYPFGTSALTRGSASSKDGETSCHSPPARLRHLREPGMQNGITKDGLGSGSFNSIVFISSHI